MTDPAEHLATLDSAVTRRLHDLTERLAQLDSVAIARIAMVLHRARQRDATVWIMGNGGSAASSLHITCDLGGVGVGGAPAPLRCHSLNADVARLTALANDHGYPEIYARQLQALARPGDVVVGISASGNSPNCLLGMARARELGLITVGLLGFDGGELLSLCDHHVLVGSFDFGLVEDVHLVLGHTLSACLGIAADFET